MKSVLALGGSNMVGRGVGGPAMNSASSLVQVWNNVNDGGAVGSAWIAPPAAGNAPWDDNGGNNSALWFCDRLARENREEVRLVLVAEGNLTIANIQPPDGERYTDILSVWAAAEPDPADILLWNNGTADYLAETSEAAYKSGFLTMWAGLKSEGIVKSDSCAIIQGLKGEGEPFNTVLENLAIENENIYYADPDGLRIFDANHFTGVDLHYLGFSRAWRAYQQHTGPRIVPGAFKGLR